MKKPESIASASLVVTLLLSGCGGQTKPAESGALEDASPRVASVPEAPAGGAAPARSELAPSEEPAQASSADSVAERKKAQGPDRLSLEVGALDDALAPEQLSCQGAKPHRDAICSIADSLCELPPEQPSTTRPSQTCLDARQSCEKARDKYKSRCGSF